MGAGEFHRRHRTARSGAHERGERTNKAKREEGREEGNTGTGEQENRRVGEQEKTNVRSL
jgi:hypothetical protein